MSPEGIGAYQFLGSSEIRVNESDGLYQVGNSGIAFSFKANALGGVLVDYNAAGLLVELTSAGKIKVSLKTDHQPDPFVLQSDENVSLNQWHQIGAHIIANELVLQVDNEIKKIEIQGEVVASEDDYSVKIGNGYEGLMASFSLYDWTEEKTISLIDNQSNTTATVGSDGFARVQIKTRPSAFIAANMERNQRLLARQHHNNPLGLILNSAYAATPSGCRQFTPDDTNIFSRGEAFFKFVAECQIQNEIEKTKIKINTASGKYERTVAMMKYATLQLAYYHTYANGVIVGSIPGCVNGAVTGNADSGAAMTCDLVTSLFLIGDIRDFVIHGTYLFTGSTDDQGNEKFNKPVFVFASLGILTTLAELTGVGVVLDAAIAGCKSAAKVLTGSKVMVHLADEIDNAVLSKPITQIPGEAKKYLQIMQVVSLVAFYGEDVRKFVAQAISQPEDLVVWIDFLKIYIAKYGGDTVASNFSPDTWKIQLFNSAYAGISDDLVAKLTTKGVKEFMELLEDVSKNAPKLRGDQTQIGKAFTNALAEIKRLYDSPVEPTQVEIAAIFHKTPSIKAFWVISHVAKGPGLTAIRNLPCVPSNCPMKTMEKFMEDVANIADLVDAGKVTESALNQMTKVFESLGHINKTGKTDEVNLNMARGAVGVITSLRRITDKKVIDGFEVSGRVKNTANKDIGERIMDVKATDGTLFEVKGWRDKTKSLEYLLGKADDEGGTVAGKISAQLLKDIVSKTINTNEKRIWIFADETMEALKSQFAKEIVDKIKKDEALKRHFTKNMGSESVQDFTDNYVANGKIQDAVNSLMGPL